MVNVLPPVTKLKRIALDLLFPQWCVGCGREGDYICEHCRQSLSSILPPVCPQCGKPQSDSRLCPTCDSENPVIDGICSPFLFDGVIRQAIHELKYHNLRALALPMAGLLYEYYLAYPVPGEVLVPVPLHRKRLRERGYNQSALLARQLGKLTGMPVIEDCLIRKQHTPPQARTANIEERRQNVVNAFSCSNGKLWGKQVILIDDVTTSGTTLNAGAKTLKESGAASVWGLVMAIEP
jgi:ComF family protein